MNSQSQLSAAQQLSSGASGMAPTLESSGAGGDDDDDDIPELEAAADDGPVDETGVDAKDIELVMQQVNCSRAKAVRVLKESGGDLINASESLAVSLHPITEILVLQSWPRASRLFVFSFLHVLSEITFHHCLRSRIYPRATILSFIESPRRMIYANSIIFASVQVLRNNWIFPIHPGQFRGLVYPECHPVAWGPPSNLTLRRLPRQGLKVLLWRTYGSNDYIPVEGLSILNPLTTPRVQPHPFLLTEQVLPLKRLSVWKVHLVRWPIHK